MSITHVSAHFRGESREENSRVEESSTTTFKLGAGEHDRNEDAVVISKIAGAETCTSNGIVNLKLVLSVGEHKPLSTPVRLES